MKITILPKEPGEEDEIIIKCDNPDQSVVEQNKKSKYKNGFL